MKKFTMQFLSPEKERKVALIASVIFMIIAWLVCFFFSGYLLMAILAPKSAGWLVLMLAVPGPGVVLIPIQLKRYFRSR